MAYKTPVLSADAEAPASWEPYALEVLAGVLDGGYSARLETRLVREQEVTASVSASYDLSGPAGRPVYYPGSARKGKDRR